MAQLQIVDHTNEDPVQVFLIFSILVLISPDSLVPEALVLILMTAIPFAVKSMLDFKRALKCTVFL